MSAPRDTVASKENAPDGPDQMKVLPRLGDVLAWSGASQLRADSLNQVLRDQGNPGVLHPRRSMHRLLEVLDPDAQAVRPGLSLVLESRLQRLNWISPSVWLARVVRQSESSRTDDAWSSAQPSGYAAGLPETLERQGSPAEHRVVLKLVYYDARERGQNVDMDTFDFINAPPLLKLSRAEADCYAALQKCQGSMIPYCYGFYKFRLANGNECIGVVTEYITGLPPCDYAKNLRKGVDDKLIDVFLTNLYRTLIEFHKVGMIYKDQASRNMRLLFPLDPSNPHFVAFDFGMSISAGDFEPMQSGWEEKHWLDLDERRMTQFYNQCSPAFEVAALAWDASQKGAKLLRRWKTHPDDLAEEERIPSCYRSLLDNEEGEV